MEGVSGGVNVHPVPIDSPSAADDETINNSDADNNKLTIIKNQIYK